jgi:hypothetical protein
VRRLLTGTRGDLHQPPGRDVSRRFASGQTARGAGTKSPSSGLPPLRRLLLAPDEEGRVLLADGEQSAERIDLLVDLDRHTFDRYRDLKSWLEDLLGRPVDRVLVDGLEDPVREKILREAIRAA